MSAKTQCQRCNGKGYFVNHFADDTGWPFYQKNECWKCGGSGERPVWEIEGFTGPNREDQPMIDYMETRFDDER